MKKLTQETSWSKYSDRQSNEDAPQQRCQTTKRESNRDLSSF